MVTEKQVRLLALVNVLFFSALVSFLVCFFFAGRALTRAKLNYNITVDHFNEAISYGVSNYLDKIVPLQTFSPSSEAPLDPPALVFVEGLGFGSTYSGNPYFILDGYRYFPGDYCKYGLIVSVHSDRVYCRSPSGISILRPSRQSSYVPPSSPGVQSPGEEEEREDGVMEPKGGLFGRIF